MKHETLRHKLALYWLLLNVIAAAALFVAWELGLLSILYETDSSGISWVITVIFLLACGHAGWRAWQISAEVDSALSRRWQLRAGTDTHDVLDEETPSIIARYVRELWQQSRVSADSTAMTELLKSYEYRMKSPQEIGWLSTDVMLKLGLVGTIVGFVMMLGSVAGVDEFNVSTMRNILQLMSIGMGTALYTTLVGIVCSLLVGFQYYLVDKGVNEILDVMREYAQQAMSDKATA